MRSKDLEKAIEELKYWRDYNIKHNTPIPAFIIANVGKVLNLIEKQEKEIENSISKDKIKDKINLYELGIEILKTLYPKSYSKDDEYKLYVIKIQELKSIIGE